MTGRSIGAIIVATVVGLFGLIVVFGSFYTIDQSERGVILRNGAIIGTAAPGFHFKMPIFDEVEKISLQTWVWSDTLPSYSRDQQPADLRISVTWRASEPDVARIYTDYGSLSGLQDRIVVPRATAAAKTVFGSYQAAIAISERGRLNSEVLEEIRSTVAGPLIVESVQVEDIAFSDAYENSVEQRMLAEVEVQKTMQNAEREKVSAEIAVTQAGAARDSAKARADGEAYAIRASADADAYRTRERSKAEAEATELRGNAEAIAISARGKALRDNPALVALVTAEKWNGELPRMLLPNAALPMVNLDGLNGVAR